MTAPGPAQIAPEDRFAIEDLLGRYFWAADTGDISGVLAAFAPNAVVRYGDGRHYEGPAQLRDFATRICDPAGRGRMHFNRPLFVEVEGDHVLLRSYLITPGWMVNEDSPTLGTLRYVEDRLIRSTEGWQIIERAIFLWNDRDAPRIETKE